MDKPRSPKRTRSRPSQDASAGVGGWGVGGFKGGDFGPLTPGSREREVGQQDESPTRLPTATSPFSLTTPGQPSPAYLLFDPSRGNMVSPSALDQDSQNAAPATTAATTLQLLGAGWSANQAAAAAAAAAYGHRVADPHAPQTPAQASHPHLRFAHTHNGGHLSAEDVMQQGFDAGLPDEALIALAQVRSIFSCTRST